MKMPKMMHMVWIGDESKMPRTMMKSWQTLNPDWQLKVWGNAELKSSKWINRKHLNAMLNSGRYSGAADIMRYEILFKHGGFALDADSFCVRPLEEWLFDSQVCASMENEHMRPGLIANGYLAAEPQAALIAEVILAIETKKTVLDELPWVATGPLLLTKTYQRLRYDNITLWPSHYFIPRHFTGAQYLGSGHIFGHQLWGTTFDINDSLTEIFARYQC